MLRQDTTGRTAFSEETDTLGREGLTDPLPLVLGEERKGVGANGLGMQGGTLYPTRCRYVCSDVLHDHRLFKIVEEYGHAFERFLLLTLNLEEELNLSLGHTTQVG